MMMTYLTENGWNLPNLTPPQETPVTGKYALMRERYLIEHQRSLYLTLLTSGTLNQHLMEIEQTARTRMSQITAQMAQEQGVTEELKARDQMKWLGLTNSIRQAAEETILNELIYS